MSPEDLEESEDLGADGVRLDVKTQLHNSLTFFFRCINWPSGKRQLLPHDLLHPSVYARWKLSAAESHKGKSDEEQKSGFLNIKLLRPKETQAMKGRVIKPYQPTGVGALHLLEHWNDKPKTPVRTPHDI